MAEDVLVKFAEWFSSTGSTTMAQLGLPGVFAAGIVLNATVFFGIPMEILLIAFYYATGTDPLLIAIFAGAGAAIGEMLTYCIGLKSSGIADRIEKGNGKFWKKALEKVRKEINNRGPIAVIVLFVFPLPVDLVGIVCGMLKMSAKKFFLASLAGKIIRYFAAVWFAIIGIEIIAGIIGL